MRDASEGSGRNSSHLCQGHWEATLSPWEQVGEADVGRDSRGFPHSHLYGSQTARQRPPACVGCVASKTVSLL